MNGILFFFSCVVYSAPVTVSQFVERGVGLVLDCHMNWRVMRISRSLRNRENTVGRNFFMWEE